MNQRTLETFRDVVIIVGLAVLVFVGIQDYVTRLRARQEQEMRFAIVQNGVRQLETAYRQQMAGTTDFNQVIVRQNQLLIEFEKLLIETAYLPAGTTSVRVEQAARPAAPPSNPPAKPR